MYEVTNFLLLPTLPVADHSTGASANYWTYMHTCIMHMAVLWTKTSRPATFMSSYMKTLGIWGPAH